jgi:lipoate-protein ligase A
MRLRVLDFGYDTAIRSQAVYHGIAEAMEPDDDPVLTIINPETPYVCVGMHQEVALEVDEEYCKQANLPIIRRHIGGGAVYLDENQMFFHFIYPRGKAPKRSDELYPKFIEPVCRTYHELGVDANFRPINDIHVGRKKIGGTGAATIENATVMVGSFMFDFDTETMAKALKVPSEKFRDKLRTSLDDYMTTMKKELSKTPSREKVKALFLKQVTECLGVEVDEDFASMSELDAINEQESILASDDWTYQLGRKFVEMGVKIAADTHLTESSHKAEGGLIRVQLLEKDQRIEDVVISGDFTCLPDSGVRDIRNSLLGLPTDEESILSSIESVMFQKSLDLPGIKPQDFAAAIMSALHRE